ncbi:GNAT family N-acetyltransferase [Salinactinospora qingdaonensis]
MAETISDARSDAAGDTLTGQFVRNVAAACEGPVAAMGGVVRRTPEVSIAVLDRPFGWLHGATLLRPLTAERVDPVLEQVEHAAAGGAGEVLLWSAWPTPDLRERGWQLHGYPTFLVLPPGGLAGPAPQAEVSEVTDTEGVRVYERIVVEGYPIPELQPYRPGCYLDERILAERRQRMWVAWHEGEPAAIGTLFTEAGIAHLALGVTLPHARRHGLWKALVHERVASASGLPVGVIASDMSRPGLEELGFLSINRFTLWGLSR